MLNDGTGNFTDSQDFYRFSSSNISGPVLEDLDGDGDLDLLFFVSESQSGEVWRNDGDGTFTAGLTFPYTLTPNIIATGDLDGDGAIEMVSANQATHLTAQLWRNNGDTTFVVDEDVTFPVGATHWAELADINGDGRVDLLMDVGDAAHIWLNNCGTLVLSPETLPEFSGVQFGDVDHDDDLDLLGRDFPGYHLWLNDGDGRFTLDRSFPDEGRNFRLVDWETDGDLDIVVFSYGGVAWLNDGDGNFTRVPVLGYDDGVFNGGIGDLNGDDYPDLFVADDENDIEVLVRTDSRWLWSATTTDGPDESGTVAIALTNAVGGASDIEFELTVTNVPPQIVAPTRIGGTENAVELDLGAFSDPGADSPWSVALDWGDGTPQTTWEMSEGGDLGAAGHDYATADVYPVTLSVTEEAGTQAMSSVELLIDTRPCDGGDLDGDGNCDLETCSDLPDSDGDGVCDLLDGCPDAPTRTAGDWFG